MPEAKPLRTLIKEQVAKMLAEDECSDAWFDEYEIPLGMRNKARCDFADKMRGEHAYEISLDMNAEYDHAYEGRGY